MGCKTAETESSQKVYLKRVGKDLKLKTNRSKKAHLEKACLTITLTT